MFQCILRLCMHYWFLYVIGIEVKNLKKNWKILSVKGKECL
jgi:hypothetical protein